MRIRKIVSGGQTGADRAAFDFALEHGIEIGGYLPKERMAEDGPLPEIYPNLVETETADPGERTRLNVIHSDGTVILSHGDPTGGSLLTFNLAEEHEKPLLHIDLSVSDEVEATDRAAKWIDASEIAVLNIAGPRASEDREIYAKTIGFLKRLVTE